jgi:hypothetical protein
MTDLRTPGASGVMGSTAAPKRAEEGTEEPLTEEAAAEVKAAQLTGDEKKFMVACAAGNKVQVELFTKEKGLSPNLNSAKFGLQPLHLVCGAGAVDCAKILVSSGADVKATDRMGLTSLHWVSTALHGSRAWRDLRTRLQAASSARRDR